MKQIKYLVVDIGNSNCKINVINQDFKILDNIKIVKIKKYDVNLIVENISKLVIKHKISTGLIGSVVLNLTKKIITQIKKENLDISLFDMEEFRECISYKIDSNLLKQKGIDLIANSEYLSQSFDGEETKGLFLFGTATVFIALKNNSYYEVAITLGLARTIINLIKDASILNKRYYKQISNMSNKEVIEFAKTVIPNIYRGSIISLEGFITECKNIYLNNKNTYFISGGDANLISQNFHQFIEEETTSKGYLLMYKNYKKIHTNQ